MVRTRHGSYLSWRDWRGTRMRRRALRLTCPTCWGQRMLLEPFAGGGLIPVTCEDCHGTGRV
jgi:hypothetical protein